MSLLTLIAVFQVVDLFQAKMLAFLNTDQIWRQYYEILFINGDSIQYLFLSGQKKGLWLESAGSNQ